jgi:predicted nucleotidyltransferase
MIQASLGKLQLPAPQEQQLKSFFEQIVTAAGENLVSIILYGGLVKNDHKTGESNINMLLVLKEIQTKQLDLLCPLIQKAQYELSIAPFLLRELDLVGSAKVFALKLFDIQSHHVLVYGEEVLSNLVFDKQNLRFVCEQEIRNQVTRLRYFYIQNHGTTEQLQRKVKSAATTFLINANMLLFLKKGIYLNHRKEIAQAAISDLGFKDQDVNAMQRFREGETLDAEQTLLLYDAMLTLFDQLLTLIENQG